MQMRLIIAIVLAFAVIGVNAASGDYLMAEVVTPDPGSDYTKCIGTVTKTFYQKLGDCVGFGNNVWIKLTGNQYSSVASAAQFTDKMCQQITSPSNPSWPLWTNCYFHTQLATMTIRYTAVTVPDESSLILYNQYLSLPCLTFYGAPVYGPAYIPANVCSAGISQSNAFSSMLVIFPDLTVGEFTNCTANGSPTGIYTRNWGAGSVCTQLGSMYYQLTLSVTPPITPFPSSNPTPSNAGSTGTNSASAKTFNVFVLLCSFGLSFCLLAI